MFFKKFKVGDKVIFDCDLEYSKKLFDFILCLEKEKEKSIAYINSLDLKEFIDRQNINDFFKKMLYIYDDVFHKKIGLPIEYFPMYEDSIDKISENNSLNDIKNKINAINLCIERNKYNPNVKLLMDKLVILMSGVDINV